MKSRKFINRGRYPGGVVLVLSVLTIVCSPAKAHAEPWLLLVDANLAVPIIEPQSENFGLGASGAIAFYRSFQSWFALGVRIRGGFLADIDTSQNSQNSGRVEPEHGSFWTGSLALRFRLPLYGVQRSTGMYFDISAGPALTGTLVRPSFEAALGWNFPVGPISIGPTVRYVQIIHFKDPLDNRDAHLLLGGLEMAFLDARERPNNPSPEISEQEALEAFIEPEPEPRAEVDPEPEIVEEPESIIEIRGDRIILDERVLFDYDSYSLKRSAIPVLQSLVELWQQHPEWEKIRIEGHADIRGTEEYNQTLSEHRAEVVRNVLITLGMPSEMLEVAGHSFRLLRDNGATESSHRRNRRVEFVIETTEEVLVTP